MHGSFYAFYIFFYTDDFCIRFLFNCECFSSPFVSSSGSIVSQKSHVYIWIVSRGSICIRFQIFSRTIMYFIVALGSCALLSKPLWHRVGSIELLSFKAFVCKLQMELCFHLGKWSVGAIRYKFPWLFIYLSMTWLEVYPGNRHYQRIENFFKA